MKYALSLTALLFACPVYAGGGDVPLGGEAFPPQSISFSSLNEGTPSIEEQLALGQPNASPVPLPQEPEASAAPAENNTLTPALVEGSGDNTPNTTTPLVQEQIPILEAAPVAPETTQAHLSTEEKVVREVERVVNQAADLAHVVAPVVRQAVAEAVPVVKSAAKEVEKAFKKVFKRKK